MLVAVINQNLSIKRAFGAQILKVFLLFSDKHALNEHFLEL